MLRILITGVAPLGCRAIGVDDGAEDDRHVAHRIAAVARHLLARIAA